MASNSAAIASTLAWSRLLAIVMAPACANPRAMACPMPLVPPNTTATRFLREKSSRAFIRVKLKYTRRSQTTETQVQFVSLQREGYVEPAVIADEAVVGLRKAGFEDMISLITGGE